MSHLGYTTAPKKKTSKTGLVVVLVVLSVLAVCACGIGVVALNGDPKTHVVPPAASSASGAAAQPAAEPAKKDTFNQPVGTTIVTDMHGGTIEAVVTAAKWQKAGCKTSATKPQTGKYVVIDITVKISAGKGSINSLYFTYIDAANTSAEAFGGIFAGCKNLDSGNDFPAGTTRSGQLVYDVAAGPGVLSWAGPLGEQIGSWTIPA